MPPASADAIAAIIAAAIDPVEDRVPGRPLVVGLCGAQGSGKSTIAAALRDHLAATGQSAATVSLDDLYLTRAERRALAHDVHPLFATRGVPGTHDVPLGRAVFAALDRGGPVRLPRFDKATDDRVPEGEWPTVDAPDVVIFEGWCVGAVAQPTHALVEPVNLLERNEDDGAVWRGWANAALAGDYRHLFARIDRHVLLAAPSFAVVDGWRREQEARLREIAPGAAGLMADWQVTRFVQHFERLTRWILFEMPARADLTIALAPDRSPLTIFSRRE